MQTRTFLLTLLAAGSVIVSACGSGSDTAGSDDVATLTDVSTASPVTSAGDGAPSSSDAETQALAFAECMRAEGLDFPDPTVDEDGNPSFDGGFRAGAAGDVDRETIQSAIETCEPLAEGLAFGPGGGNRADPSEIQDALLPFTTCLRDEGLDVGDFTFDGPGGNDQPAADPEASGDGAGRGQRGPGGDPSTRILDSLGIDAEDPAAMAALEICQPLFDEAFAELRPNQ